MKRTSVRFLLSVACLMAKAAFGIQTGPSSITYTDSAGNQHIYSFVIGDNQHLVVNYWDGFNWYWHDQGLPPGNYLGMDVNVRPAAITYASGGQQFIYVFAAVFVSGSFVPHLAVNYWDGTGWYWHDQGLPPGAATSNDYMGSPTAITYLSGGHQVIDVFTDLFQNSGPEALMMNSWDGYNWSWSSHALPAGISSIVPGSLTSITYPQIIGQRIYVFAAADNGHLVVNYYDGFNWYWADQSVPVGVSQVASPAAITYVSGGKQQIYVFATANTGHLVVNYWDGSAWHWRDQGLPPAPAGTAGVGFKTAITYARGGLQLIYVFAGAYDAHFNSTSLVVNYWDGFNWYWSNQGLPAGISGACTPSAITYATQQTIWVPQIYVFAEGGNSCGSVGSNDLVVNYWNGAGWYWSNQGTM